mgnify:FL=1
MTPTLAPRQQRPQRQHGLVLFFALIAMVVMSLAAVALIRAVDTSTLIAGNLAFRRSTTTSGDAGVEAALAWLTQTQTASAGISVQTDGTHPFNRTDLVARPGYFSSADPALDLTADATWTAANGSVLVGTDASGNTVSYLIQRMCRTANQPIQSAGCLFAGTSDSTSGMQTKRPQDVVTLPTALSPMLRITVRSSGPKATTSYIQAYVY